MFIKKTIYYLSCSTLALSIQFLEDEAQNLWEKVINSGPAVDLCLLLLHLHHLHNLLFVLVLLGLLFVVVYVAVVDIGPVDTPLGDPAVGVLVGQLVVGLAAGLDAPVPRLVELSPLGIGLILYEVGNVEEVVAVPARQYAGHVDVGPAPGELDARRALTRNLEA